jgi:hypothetical protein
MARDSCMSMIWKCWSGKQTILICNAGFHFEVDITSEFDVFLKVEDILTVFNLSIVLCEQVCPDLDKKL